MLTLQERKRQVGDELLADMRRRTEAALADFKANLERFALQHRAAIRADPTFRAQFHAMCAHIGVDPLASNKAAVSRLLDFKGWSFASFYYALGVTVVEVRTAHAGRFRFQIVFGQVSCVLCARVTELLSST